MKAKNLERRLESRSLFLYHSSFCHFMDSHHHFFYHTLHHVHETCYDGFNLSEITITSHFLWDLLKIFPQFWLDIWKGDANETVKLFTFSYIWFAAEWNNFKNIDIYSFCQMVFTVFQSIQCISVYDILFHLVLQYSNSVVYFRAVLATRATVTINVSKKNIHQ